MADFPIPGPYDAFHANPNEGLEEWLLGELSPRTVYGPRWVFDGDSITINGIATQGDGSQDRGASWTVELAGRGMGAIDYIYNAAVAGQRLDDALARFGTHVAPQTPDVVLLTAGTNDVGQGRSLAAYLADLDAYLAKCVGIGARLIVGAIWPTDATDVVGRGTTTRTWNNSVYAWAKTNAVDVVPWDRLADPITGGWPSGWSSDNIHPGNQDSYAQIGLFGYNALAAKIGEPNAVRRAVVDSDSLVANGFFLTLSAAMGIPTLSAAVPSTASGTLPAGAYSYKATSRTYWGETLPSAELTGTLGGTGQITFSITSPTGNRAKRIYRKGPGDTTWKYIGSIATTTNTFTDDGSAVAGTDAPTVDTAQVVTGFTGGSASLHKLDGVPLVRAVEGIRGNVLHLTPYETGTSDFNDYLSTSSVAPGDVLEITMLARTSGPGVGAPIVRWRNGAAANGQRLIANTRMPNGWRLLHLRVAVFANTTSMRISFEGAYTVDWLEVAELRVVKIN